jgi:HPt (histidine-containing phosphotransfer) domain-containing protein
MGEVDRYVRLLGQFVDKHGLDASVLSDQLAAGDVEAVRCTAHALKGVAGILGAEGVQRSAQVLESGAKAGVSAAILGEQVVELAAELRVLLQGLEGVLPQGGVKPEAVEVDAGRVAEVLGRLEGFLEESDTGAEALFERNWPMLKSALGEAAEVMGRQIRDFDYPKALETLRGARRSGQG